MIRLRQFLVALVVCSIAFSCASSPPKPQAAQAPQIVQAPSPTQPNQPAPPQIAPAFNPAEISAETKHATFTDIRAFIDNLNQIIRRKDFEAWRANLTADYIAYYSNPAVLHDFSQYPVIKNQGIELKNIKDFFIYVVYPAHQNDRVDDIEFINENLVKAITISPTGDRNILYILEKQGDTWKIGIGRQ